MTTSPTFHSFRLQGMSDWEFSVFGREELVRSHLPVALTIGNFDGVHLGHRRVIQTLKEFSDGLPLLALTFAPHPSHILFPSNGKPSVIPLRERVDLLLGLGVDTVVVQKFDAKFARLSADDFISRYLLQEFSLKKAVIGFDFCYGAGRLGDWSHFSQSASHFGFDAKRADVVMVEGAPVSSTRIRTAIHDLDFPLAEMLLGRSFALSGLVVRGDQRGRQIGFPTANLGLEEELPLLPPYGVYAVEVVLPGEQMIRYGVMNCGVRPTIASGLRLQIETHILDYSGDLYGKKITFCVRKFIRTEMKFSGLEQLKEQIQSDVGAARNFFGV